MKTNANTMKRKHNFRKGRIAIIAIAVEMALIVLTGFICVQLSERAYAISANDKVLCYVKDKKAAVTSVDHAIHALSEEKSEIKIFSSNAGLKIAPTRLGEPHNDDISSVNEAVDYIVAEIKDENSDLKLDVVSVRSELETFTPDPIYKEDGTKLAGYTNIEEEGRDGKTEVTYVYHNTDGKQTEKKAIEKTVIKEGNQAVIVKGTLGVPAGEAWETYEGSPVLNDGNDIIVSAKQYVGKLQYVKGGTSLTNGVDCVGFVQAIYKLYGVKLSPDLKKAGRGVSYSQAEPGDILCFPHHFAMYMGDGKMIHAANPHDDVCVGKVNPNKIIAVRRIVN